MSYKNQDKCIAKAYDDEMLFVLMARDITAPDVIDFWIILNRTKQPAEKLAEARACANTMRETRGTIVKRKEKDQTAFKADLSGHIGGENMLPEINTIQCKDGKYININDLIKYFNVALDEPLYRDSIERVTELLNTFK